MKKNKYTSFFLNVLSHIAAVLFLYILTLIYFSPAIFENKDLPQGDTQSANGMLQEYRQYEKETGELSEWTNSMFSGMPLTPAAAGYKGKIPMLFSHLRSFLTFGLPTLHAAVFFAFLLGFYIFMICIGSSVWLAIFGAIAYGLASFNLISIDAGHVTKAYAMAYLPPLIGSVWLVFRKKYLAGGILTIIFSGILLVCNHMQITYYAFIIILCIFISFLIYYIIENIHRREKLHRYFISAGILIIAAIIATGTYMFHIIPLYEYSKDTMRGGSELTIVPDSKQAEAEVKPNEGGLEIDYAFAWSYGKAETFTLLVPNCYGSGHTILDKSDPTLRELRNAGYGSTYLPTYWGDQPFTAGPVYVGAIVCFLFILGLFVVKGPEKWWVIAAVIISFILAWGRNLMPINEWLFHHLPMYNKFRTPSMALTIAGVAMPILGMFALKEIFSGNVDKKQAWKYTWISAAISGGLCLLVMLLGKTAFTYTGAGDANFQQQLASAGFDQGRIDSIMSILVNYRESMLMKDAFRSLAFIALAFGVLALYCKNIVKKEWIIGVSLIVLVLADMWPVAQRYLNDDHFVTKKKIESSIAPTETDNAILQDPDINYRVLNLASNTFNESQTSYFHKSIGGYSPAKLRRYQDMIDFYIADQMQSLYREIVRTQGNIQTADPNKFQILNMLNTKYIILPTGDNKTIPLQNPYCFGNAWFVNEAQIVANPDEEILALGKTDLKNVAVVDQRYKDYVSGKDFTRDTSATIVNTLCKPNKLKYTVNASKEQLVVFSEVFYDKGGWVAHIDGQEVPHFRSNYILRAMVVPAGQHEIEFNYIPYARILGCKISDISSIICILIILAGCGWGIYKRKKEGTAAQQ